MTDETIEPSLADEGFKAHLDEAREIVSLNTVAGPCDEDDDTAVITTGGMIADIAVAIFEASRKSAAPPSPRSDDGSGLTPHSTAVSAIGSADAVDWRQRYFEARDALFQFKYPPDPKLLRDVAAEIDCGSDCEHGHTEWDTNAHVCSRSDSKDGCDGEKASCLRQFADAIDVCASLQREALSEGASPEAVIPAIAQERDVGEPVAYRARRIAEPDHWFFLTLAGVQALGEGMEVQPLYLHPTTSPSAISEAPASADAVKTSPEVGEIVERLKKATIDIDGSQFPLDARAFGFSVERCLQATSLLIALDAERGRTRAELDEALDRVEHLEGAADQVSEEFDKECWKIVRRLLNDIGFDWQYADNEVTAEQAYEYISAALPIRDSEDQKS